MGASRATPASGNGGSALVRGAVSLAWTLRGGGLPVTLSRIIEFVRALEALPAATGDDLYWAARLTFCASRTDIDLLDRIFGQLRQPDRLPARREPFRLAEALRNVTSNLPRPGRPHVVELPAPEGEAPDAAAGGFRYSPAEALKRRDFAAYNEEESAAARRLMAAMKLRPPQRLSRRTAVTLRGSFDFGRTIRRAMRTLGEPLTWRYRSRRLKSRRLVFLCDISGSMSDYSRPILLFLHAAVQARRGVEAFCFGTRLTRVTRELSRRGGQEAIDRAASAVSDWSGGTRLGECLKAFCDRWAQKGLARGAVVTIISDGWDRGDPSLVTAQMARLRRLSHRVIWVNPLKSFPGYEPLAGGMAAAIPYIDEFLPGHNLATLEAFLTVVSEAASPRGGRPARAGIVTGG